MDFLLLLVSYERMPLIAESSVTKTKKAYISVSYGIAGDEGTVYT